MHLARARVRLGVRGLVSLTLTSVYQPLREVGGVRGEQGPAGPRGQGGENGLKGSKGERGLPGSGWSICKDNCYCQLVPESMEIDDSIFI